MTTVLFIALKEILLTIIGRIGWHVVAERFATRLIVCGLTKLTTYTSNDLLAGTAQDIINELKGKRLHVIENEVGTKAAK